jgi:hypothetical protein
MLKTPEDRLVDLVEAGQVLGGICARTVKRLIARGILPKPVKVTRTPMLYWSDIQKYLAELKRTQRGVIE